MEGGEGGERRVTNAANFSDTVSNCPISDGEEVKRKTFLTAATLGLTLLSSAHSPNARAQKRRKKTCCYFMEMCCVLEFSLKNQKTAPTALSHLQTLMCVIFIPTPRSSF